MQKKYKDTFDNSERTRICLLIIDIISPNIKIIRNNIHNEYYQNSDINDYSLDPKQLSSVIQKESDELLNYLKTEDSSYPAHRGIQAAIGGLNKDLFNSLYTSILACLQEKLAQKNLNTFLHALNILTEYKDIYLESFQRQIFSQKLIEQQGLYDALLKTTITQKEKIIAKERELSEQRRFFLISFGHEIKTPLTITRAAIHRMKKVLGNKRLPGMDDLEYSIEEITTHINDIMDYEKIMQGKTLYTHDTLLDISHTLQKKLHAMDTYITEKGLTFTTDIETDLCSRIAGPAFFRIINNILENTVKNHLFAVCT